MARNLSVKSIRTPTPRKFSRKIANHFARIRGVLIDIDSQDWGTSGIDANCGS